jgi:hypothetical protein
MKCTKTLGLSSIPAEIRIEHLPRLSLHGFHYVNPQCKYINHSFTMCLFNDSVLTVLAQINKLSICSSILFRGKKILEK